MERHSKVLKPLAKNIIIILLMVCTAVLITVSSVKTDQSFLRVMPLYVSLFIALLQSRVNRFASLLGSVNSIVYGIVYVHYGLYGSALSAFLFSCPIQMLTFIRWNKNKRGNSTLLRKLSWGKRGLLALGFCAALAAMCILLPKAGAKYVFLDSVSTLLGIVIYFLTMFAFVEYTVLMIVNGIIGIFLNAVMVNDSPEIWPFLIFSVYSWICITFAFFEARRIYASQQIERESRIASKEYM